MLPRHLRLPTSRILPLLKSGSRSSYESMQLIYKKTQNGNVRFAVIVPIRIEKRTVMRNRMKRFVRVSIRHLAPLILPGVDGILMAKYVKGITQSSVEAHMLHLFMAGRLYSKKSK